MREKWPLWNSIRPLNLGLIAVLLLVIRYCLLDPLLTGRLHPLLPHFNADFHFALSNFDFALLICSVVCICLAGNLYNDIQDTEVDAINKRANLFQNKENHNLAYGLYALLNLAGIGTAVYVGSQIHIWELGLIHVFAAASLYMYNTQFKGSVLVGNLIVAILAGLVPLIPILYEMGPLILLYREDVQLFFLQYTEESFWSYFKRLFYAPAILAGFAFFSTLIREIMKDLADRDGDQKTGYRTFAVVYGVKKTQYLILFLGACFLVGFGALFYFLQQNFIHDAVLIPTLSYVLLGIVLPFVLALVRINKQQDPQTANRAANLVKVCMLFGCLYPLFNYVITG